MSVKKIVLPLNLRDHLKNCIGQYIDDLGVVPGEIFISRKVCVELFRELGFKVTEKKPFPIGEDGEVITNFYTVPLTLRD